MRFDAEPGGVVRVEVHGRDRDGEHELSVGFQPGEAKRFKVDGAPAERLLDAPHRPLVSVFLPDRLELVKGPPALRRSHLDQVVGALWPARDGERAASTAQTLAQRNALLARVRAGGSRSALAAWDLELARHGIALRDDRAAALDLLRPRFAEAAARARPRRRRGAALPPAHAGREPRGAGGRAGRAPGRRPRARLHHARPAPRRRRPAARRARAARLRLAGRAADGPARAAAGRARRPGGRARRAAAAAPRRRHERARLRPPRAAGRAPARRARRW